jgi:dolichyl-phosphate-mannose-protein mannosyltransferase
MMVREKLKHLWRKLPAELWGLWAIALLTRLPGLTFPKSIVFDEVYFTKYPAQYFTHHYYFDPHPPLGKELIAGWAKLWHMNPASMMAPGSTTLRILIALFGVAIVPLVYGIVRRLSGSRLSAALAGLIVAIDMGLIVEARLVLMDSILLAFGLGAIYAALRWRDNPRWYWLVATGLLIGAAGSIKWTGLAPALIALLIMAWSGLQRRLSLVKMSARVLSALAIGFALYVAVFAVHFALLRQSGPDDDFMSAKFQSTLVGSPMYNPNVHMSFWSKFVELNHTMYGVNADFTATHPYGSSWYNWPIMRRPIYYWEGDTAVSGKQGNIYFIDNPISLWLGSASVVIAAAALAVPRWRRRLGKTLVPATALLLFAYLVNWLPFAKISRVMFQYHYLFAFIFSIMLLSVLVGRLKQRRRVAISLAVVLTLVSLFWAPLVYGWQMTPRQLDDHIWFSSWR